MMSVILDLVLVLLIAGSVILCARRGFIRSLASVAGCLFSWYAAFRWCRPLGTLISERWIAPVWKERFLEKMGEGAGGTIVNVSKLLETVPSFFEKLLGSYNVTPAQLETALQGSTGTPESLNQQAAELVVTPAAQAVSVAVAFVLLLVGGLLIFGLLAWVLDKIFCLPVLRVLNTAGGVVCGSLIGLLLALLFAGAVSYATPYIPALQPDENGVCAADRTLVFRHFERFDFTQTLAQLNLALTEDSLPAQTQPGTAAP